MSENPVIKITRVLGQLLLMLAILAAILFLPAGSLNWPQAWLLIAILGIYFLLYALWGIYRDPEQFQERSHIAKNVKRWDRIIMGTYTALLPAVFIVAGLDAVRFGWSEIPLVWQVLAWAGLIFAGILILWTVSTNTYLSRYVRIQEDRQQQVVITGPYRYVRHPMYSGILILFLSLGPALGSWCAIIPGAVIDILFFIRTAKEDKTLQKELAGYQGYTEQVRYRLIPGIW